MKLGKLPAKHDPRTLRLTKYLRPELPEPPVMVDYTKGILEWPMYLNDQIGDCTCASAAHMIQTWTQASRGDDIVLTDGDVLHAYRTITGYDPDDPSTDRGAVEHDVLKYWRKEGIAGRKIGAWVDVDVKDIREVRQALFLFGGLYIGVALPKSAQTQLIWDKEPGPDGKWNSWGGHAVAAVYYDDSHVGVPTWNRFQFMTWEFWTEYVDEAHAIVSADWLNPATGLCPPGIDIEQLYLDLKAVGE